MLALCLMPVMPVGWGKVRQGREGGAGEAPSSDQLRCYPSGNFSDTSTLKLLQTKGAIGHAFTVCINTENQNQVSFYPFVLHEISVLIEFTLGHLRYHLTDVPPQPNSQPDSVFFTNWPVNVALILENDPWSLSPLNPISNKTIRVVVFHCCIAQGGHSNFRNKFKYNWV